MNPDRIAIWYRYKTCAQMAVKYGVSHDTMRKFVSDHGIPDPKLCAATRDRRLALKFSERYGWSVREIAHQLNRPARFVRRALRVVKGDRPCRQLCLDLFGDQYGMAA